VFSETEVVLFAVAVVLMGDVVEASRTFNEDKANRAAVDANRKLAPVLHPDALLLVLFFAAEQDISKDAVG